MKSRNFVVLLALAAVALTFPVTVMGADTPKVELLGGYEFLRDSSDSVNFPFGWNAAVNYNLSPTLGVVADIGASYKSESFAGVSADLTVWGFMFGPKWASRTNERFTPYFQALAGFARASGSVGVSGVSLGSGSTTEFAIQPGGGVDIHLNEGVAFRLGGDYRRIFVDGGGSNEFRFVTGVVFRLGNQGESW